MPSSVNHEGPRPAFAARVPALHAKIAYLHYAWDPTAAPVSETDDAALIAAAMEAHWLSRKRTQLAGPAEAGHVRPFRRAGVHVWRSAGPQSSHSSSPSRRRAQRGRAVKVAMVISLLEGAEAAEALRDVRNAIEREMNAQHQRQP